MSTVVCVRKDGEIALAADTRAVVGITPYDARGHRVVKLLRGKRDPLTDGFISVGISGFQGHATGIQAWLDENPIKVEDTEVSVQGFALNLRSFLVESGLVTIEQCSGEQNTCAYTGLPFNLLVAGTSLAWYVGADLSTVRVERYMASGSGSEFAMGALEARYEGSMSAGLLARRALEVSSVLDVYTGPRAESSTFKDVENG